ncbi:MAG: tetratricopeptide repeat protein [Candidatus Sericytochromatia bacterium]|nr:tetratricopeptide repeat protein [Candidatus Tanganyikabacteria bacterium]
MLEWGAPYWFLALVALGPLGLWLGRSILRASRLRKAFAPRALWRRMRLAGDDREVALRALAGLCSLALIVTALADPRGGGGQGASREQEAPRLLVLLDASRSMLAADTVYGGMLLAGDRGPTRFEAARSLAREAISHLGGWNIGLLVFAADPLVLCPVTSDHSAALTLLERARAGDPALRGGSNIESALRAAGALLGGHKGSILLISDGEELAGRAAGFAGALAGKGIRVYAVGVGGAEAVPLRLPGGDLATWRGATVMTARNDKLLGDLAARTRGKYWAPHLADGGVAATPLGVTVAGGLDTPAGRRQPGPSRRAPLVAAALALLALDALWILRRRLAVIGRKVLAVWLGSRRPAAGARPRPVGGPARAIVALLALFLLPGWTWPGIPFVQQGLAAYREGEAAKSAEYFEEAARRDPAPEVRYDLGNAYHVAGNYRQSLRAYAKALEKLPPRSRLAEHTHYNIGNTRFRLGDYRGAIAAYKRALGIDPRDEDAKHNMRLAESRLAGAAQQRAPGGRQASGAPGRATGPVPVPDAAEAAALLARLDLDERQRQAEQAQREERADPSLESPSQLARRLLKEAERSVTRQLEKDW